MLVASAIRDITERKRAEADRATLIREQAARAEAESTNRIKDEFLMTLSHELGRRSTPFWAGCRFCEAAGRAMPPNGRRVLVVDDRLDERQLFEFVLEHAGAEVRTASCAEQAILTAESWRPDVLLSDIAMPDEDGYALLRSFDRATAICPPSR
jgi:PleD family two-component response regulator